MTGTEEYYSQKAQEYAEKQSFEEMPDEAEKQLKQILDRFLNLAGSGPVLDAGCGPGRDTEYFARQGFKSAGIDSAEGMIQEALERNSTGAKYTVMSVTDLGFDSATFNGVWCNTVMQFLTPEQMNRAVEEIHRVLKPGGIFYSTFKTGGQHKGDGPERYTVSDQKVLQLLQHHGFEEPEGVTKFQLNGMDVMAVFCRKKR